MNYGNIFHYIANFENTFCLLRSHHPEQVLKVSNMFKGDISGGVPL